MTQTKRNPTGNLIVISAPSGAGKTSLIQALLARVDGLTSSISHTTRPPRNQEIDGQDYHFVDEKQFAAMVDRQEFLESAQVFGNHYGTSSGEIQRALETGEDLVLEIDWQGARVVRSAYPEAVSIFILPPSEGTLRERLIGRGNDSAEVIERRMREALSEMSHFDEYQYLIINDDFSTALDELSAIVRSNRFRTAARRHRLGADLTALIASIDAI